MIAATRHLLENQSHDQNLQDQTFFMSNMAPQLPKLNRNAWKSLEEQTRAWAKKYGEAYAIESVPVAVEESSSFGS